MLLSVMIRYSLPYLTCLLGLLAMPTAIAADDPESLAERFNELRRDAKEGDADAMCHLAKCYEHGYGVRPSTRNAVEWYTKAAEKGNEAAAFEMARRYAAGEGVKPDAKKAVEMYTALAEEGNKAALYELGSIYYRNKDGLEEKKKDSRKDFALSFSPEKAEACWKKALKDSEREQEKYVSIIADTWRHTRGSTPSLEDEQAWVSAITRDVIAVYKSQFALANLYFESPEKEYNAKAVELFLPLAELQLPPVRYEQHVLLLGGFDRIISGSCAKLAECYKKGIGVEKSSKLADKYEKKAAHLTYANPDLKPSVYRDVAYRKAQQFQSGIRGTAKSPRDAMKWFKIAAELGHKDAQRIIKRRQ